MNRVTSRLSEHTFVLFAFASLAVAMTWPLVTRLDTHLVNAKWYYDAMTNIMILGTRVQYFLGRSSLGLYENYFCAPVPYSIVFNENLFGLSLIYLPIYLVTGSYLLSYNLLLLLCLTLTGYCTWLLVKHLTGSSPAGFVGGVAFAFCPYIFFELGRIQLVAAQWVPLCAFFMHRAIEKGRLRDMAGLGICFVMQVGSCLYYALFLLFLFAFAGVWLLIANKRYEKKFWLQLAAVGFVSSIAVGFMTYPYLATRDNYALTRSTDKARQYSGTVSSLLHVYPENKTLSFLHYDSLDGSEQVAFPGFTVTVLALLAFAFALRKSYKRGPPEEMRRRISSVVMLSILVFFSSIGSAVVFGTYLGAFPIVIGAVIYWRKSYNERMLPSTIALYGCFLFFAGMLFQGIQPMKINTRPITGLYDYFYIYVPGFDGIRYVSRQIILIMLALVILAGFAAADIFRSIQRRALRLAVFTGLVLLISVEFLNAPMSLREIPTRNTLPGSYRWLARHRSKEPIAIVPGHYLGYYGALHNYYSLFHRRRTLNGKSSWIPPITRLFIHEMRRFPRESGWRLLKTLGVKYLVVQTDELQPDHAERIVSYLRIGKHRYREIFASQNDYLFELLDDGEKPPRLLPPVKPLDSDVVALHAWQISSNASRNSRISFRAIDRDPLTNWNTGREQMRGDWFEYRFKRVEKVVAIDIKENEFILDAPFSFALSVSLSPEDKVRAEWKPIINRPYIELPSDLLYQPKNLLFRILLPQPTPARRVRIELLDTVPGHFWTIAESEIWIKDQ
ncbi:MAG: hypothetical protein JXA30_09440 [Deltaproteobacteria bacterium]|nr:hypothetical protein [Deltaproteobacteria bacterium]